MTARLDGAALRALVEPALRTTHPETFWANVQSLLDTMAAQRNERIAMLEAQVVALTALLRWVRARHG